MRSLSILISLLLMSLITVGQTTVNGVVKDNKSMLSISGVTVSIKGKPTATQTDAKGQFTITATPTDSLQFVFLGYASQTVPIANRTQLNVFLEGENESLDEVVVIGYGTAKKRDLTGSIVQVKGSDIVDRPGTNPVASLQGKVSGLQVTNSGRPGQEPDIRIRGTNSINGAKPIYVVDGLLNDNINFLNPDDVESIEVLKDPSSLAIFGVAGANGVIAITTKRAKAGQLNFDFSSRIGFKDVSHRMKLTDATQFKELYEEQRFNQGDAPYDYSFWNANTDWQDEIFRNGILNYNNLSVASATDKNSFRMGLGYSLDQGIINYEKHSQITLNLSNEVRVTDNFKTGIVLNGYRAQLPQNRDVFGTILAAPIAPVFNEEYGLYHTMPSFQRAQVGNPLTTIEERKNTFIGNNYRIVGNYYAEVKFLKNFSFRTNLSADYGFNQTRSYDGLVSVYNPEIEGDNKAERIGNLLTAVNQDQNKYYKIQTDWLLNYNNSFDKHNIQAMVGYTTYMSGFENTTARRTQGDGYEIPNDSYYWYVGIGDPKTQTGNGTGWETRTLSYLARVLYNYDGKYLINTSFRKDGSSAFARFGKPWQDFYALGVAWVLSQENFMQNQTVINNLKIKGSVANLGNQSVGSNKYPMQAQMVAGNTAVFGNQVVPAYGPEYIPDTNLHWEVVKAWEAGFELSTLNNRLNIEAVYYSKNTDGVLVRVPGILGSLPGLSNLGNIRNKGIEASARWNQTLSEDWKFSIGGNITTIDNNVVSLSSKGYDIIDGPSRTTEGNPIGYFWGYVHDGIFQTQTDVNQSAKNGLGGGDFKPGDIRYKDIDGDGTITTKDRTRIGNPTPDFFYGLSLSTSYKRFDLNVEFQGIYGNEIMRTWNQNQFATYNFLTDRMDRWNGEGTSNWEPIIHEGRANNRVYSSYFIEDGSFFRLRDVTLAYTFPQETLGKLRLKNLRLFANAQNAFTFSNNTGFTPEIGGSATSFGVDRGTYPVPAIYTLGVNLNF
ncbi:SusC/RagA family TonB-linked outer membrane protein [Sphingobacterium luzhongxinii]|uniref:SusC/RagA family TonB-linked outer membrane protein n=1 Tax=Sphingobacterium luzhongxinii TaxID=2654181 RepID=UPI0013DD66A8|nr:TonB-dependent receptor [Sphingobacterium sp. xlx-73]